MDDPWVTCPYDPIHRVPLSRIQRHLVKCERNHPKLMICPYNATHRYPEDKIKAHIDHCPAKPVTQIDDMKDAVLNNKDAEIGKAEEWNDDEEWDN